MIYIACDVDGTLIEKFDRVNKDLVKVLNYLSNQRDVRLIVWSGGGADYARTWGERAKLKNVWCYSSKLNPNLPKPDIAFDDMDGFSKATINIIVGR